MNNYKIYKHTTPSNKIYIGLTCTSIYQRWMRGKGYSTNKHFTNAIKKYGWDNIEHEILEDNLTLEDAIEKEMFYIKKYNCTNPKNGYNISPGGYAVNEETKKLMKRNNKKRIKILCIRTLYNSVIDYYEISIYDSITQYCKDKKCPSETYISKDLKKHNKNIEKCKLISTKNFDAVNFILFNKLKEYNFYRYEDELLEYLLNEWEKKDKIIKVIHNEYVTLMS